MGETPTGGEARAGLARRAFAAVKDRPLRQLAGWLAGLGLVLTAPFGGWADAAKPAMTVATPDQVVHTGPIDVTITRVSSTTRPGENFPEVKDGQYLLVFGTAKSTSKTTLTNAELQDAVRLAGVDGLRKGAFQPPLPVADSLKAKPTVYAVQDATMMADLVPDLPFEVAWIFERVGGPAPSSVDVQVQSFTYRQRVVDDYTGWLDPEPRTHLRLPVTVKPPYARPTDTPSPGPSGSAS